MQSQSEVRRYVVADEPGQTMPTVAPLRKYGGVMIAFAIDTTLMAKDKENDYGKISGGVSKLSISGNGTSGNVVDISVRDPPVSVTRNV